MYLAWQFQWIFQKIAGRNGLHHPTYHLPSCWRVSLKLTVRLSHLRTWKQRLLLGIIMPNELICKEDDTIMYQNWKDI